MFRHYYSSKTKSALFTQKGNALTRRKKNTVCYPTNYHSSM
ncbi:hypothetical protein ECDEC12A_4036 [Escherichia coli DEC12A]|nr:hypothetical protein ECDEC7B_3552 [Escherichia coli DEC7B]EHX27577.1 hypothetical protein ECDEC12A_4036 [Escherichia coli DEC12A]